MNFSVVTPSAVMAIGSVYSVLAVVGSVPSVVKKICAFSGVAVSATSWSVANTPPAVVAVGVGCRRGGRAGLAALNHELVGLAEDLRVGQYVAAGIDYLLDLEDIGAVRAARHGVRRRAVAEVAFRRTFGPAKERPDPGLQHPGEVTGGVHGAQVFGVVDVAVDVRGQFQDSVGVREPVSGAGFEDRVAA